MMRGVKRKRAAVFMLIFGLFSLPVIMTWLDADDTPDAGEASFAVDLANLPLSIPSIPWPKDQL
jgi:hypothetical protein